MTHVHWKRAELPTLRLNFVSDPTFFEFVRSIVAQKRACHSVQSRFAGAAALLASPQQLAAH